MSDTEYTAGFRSGQANERERITKLAKDAICFDHLETAHCDHPACFALDRLIAQIHEEQTHG